MHSVTRNPNNPQRLLSVPMVVFSTPAVVPFVVLTVVAKDVQLLVTEKYLARVNCCLELSIVRYFSMLLL